MYTCSVCHNIYDGENAEILLFSEHGSAKCICPSCRDIYEKATLSHDADEAEENLRKLRDLTADNHDLTVLAYLSEIIPEAEKRAEAVRNGSYDFNNDEETAEDFPEELLLTEEEKAEAEAEEAERQKAEAPTLFDKIIAGGWIALGVAVVGFIVYFAIKIIF